MLETEEEEKVLIVLGKPFPGGLGSLPFSLSITSKVAGGARSFITGQGVFHGLIDWITPDQFVAKVPRNRVNYVRKLISIFLDTTC